MKSLDNQRDLKKYNGRFMRTKTQMLYWSFLIPTIFGLIIYQWRPIFVSIYMSFFKTQGYNITDFVGFKNYKNVLTDTMLTKTVINSLKYVFWSLVIGSPAPIIFALWLNEVVHGKQMFKILTYLPAVIPALASSLIWMNLLGASSGGLLNQLFAKLGLPTQLWLANAKWTIPLIVVTMSWGGYAGTMIIYLSSLQTLNQDLYEAAAIDGAGIWRRMFTITLPHLAPTILLMLVQQIIGVFQVFEQPLIMTDGGPNNASLSIGLTAYKMAFQYGQLDRAIALNVVTFCLLIIATLTYFKIEKKLSE